MRDKMKKLQTEEAFFEEIYNSTYVGLRKFVQRRSQSNVMVDDILQEVYIEVFKHLKELRNHENIAGWVYKTADNKTKKLNEIYNRYSIREIQLEEWRCIVEEEKIMEIIQLEEYKSVLREDEFALLMLKYREGFSHKELAEMTGITEGNSKMKLSRIIHKLKKNIRVQIFYLLFF